MKVFLLIVTIILCIALIAQIALAIVCNSKLERGFARNDYVYDYEDALESGTFDLDRIRRYFPSAVAAIGSNKKQEDIISSPTKIRYYENMGDTLPVCVIEKGQKIIAWRYGSMRSFVGYGITSLPTNKQSWRLAIPFSTESTLRSEKLLYVKLNELQRVAGEWIEVIDIGKQFLFRSDAVRTIVLLADKVLYDQGIFFSKDMMKPIWSPAMITTFILLMLSLGANIFLRIRKHIFEH